MTIDDDVSFATDPKQAPDDSDEKHEATKFRAFTIGGFLALAFLFSQAVPAA